MTLSTWLKTLRGGGPIPPAPKPGPVAGRQLHGAGGVTAAEFAEGMRRLRANPTPNERDLMRFRCRHMGDPRPFARYEERQET
jgi:hypothetical protein